jgi:hypothetical protein
LRAEVIEFLKNWVCGLDLEIRKNLLEMNQNLIKNKIISNTTERYHSDKAITLATRFSSILYDANKISSQKIAIQDFYNHELSKKIDSREDFLRWHKNEGFSFCKYPFILEPSLKSKLLTYESRVTQNLQRRVFLNFFLYFFYLFIYFIYLSIYLF